MELTKGKDTFEQSFEIVYDGRSGLSDADRQFKHDIVMKMYDMTEELAYIVYQVDAMIESPKTKSKIKTELTELKKTLVITTGDNYVGTAESELREKMADLFLNLQVHYLMVYHNCLQFY